VVLTADRALFSDFNGLDALGFGLCLPVRLVPWLLEYRILAPPAKGDSKGRALFAPYNLAKIEAALLAYGFKHDDVVIAPPEKLEKVVDEDTAVIGVGVVDPQGLAPVSWTLKAMTGGGTTCTQYEFEKLMWRIKKIREKRGMKFKLVIGGPGAWQLRRVEDRFGIDVLVEGEGEVTFPLLVERIMRGEEVPRHIQGEPTPLEKVPFVSTPSRNGLVEITRGCPRRCHFCSPTMKFFRTIPLENVLKELELNLSRGSLSASFVTEDVLLYGASATPLKFNPDAVMKLYEESLKVAKRYGIEKIGFSHVTLSSCLANPKVVRFISEVNNLSPDEPFLPQVGIESGSPRIVARYFAGKPWPWKAEEWQNVVIEASKLINENYWYPCYTYIVGFPGETADDYMKTLELLDKLKSERLKGWLFPLLLIPMGGTLMENRAKFHPLKELPQEAIEVIASGWRHSIEFSEWIYPILLNNIKNPVARKIAFRFAKEAFNAMRSWIETLAKDPEALEKFSRVNIRTLRALTTALIAEKLTSSRSKEERIPSGVQRPPAPAP